MTTAKLVTRLQTLLDDAGSDHWEVSEMHAALTDGQKAVIQEVLKRFILKRRIYPDEPLPEVLRPLLTKEIGSTTKDLPSGYLLWIEIYSTNKQILVRDKSAISTAQKNNTYLASSTDQPFCSITASQIVFETNVPWTMDYIKLPNDINTNNNPALDDLCMNAVVQFAFGFLLKKDKRYGEANTAFTSFQFHINQLY